MEVNQKKLTREEKIAQFDELRRNYSAMMKSLKFYEGECAKLTNTDSLSIKVETMAPETLKSEDHSKDEGKWKMDADLPTGWRYAEHLNPTFNPKPMKTYLSPKGKIFSGIGPVLKELIENGEGREPLMKYLRKEGWFETELLPPGHFMRQKPSEKGFTYLTSKAEKFSTTVRMVKYLKEEYKWEEKLVERFLNEHKSLYSDNVLSRNPLTKIKLEKTYKNKDVDVEKQDESNNQSGLNWQHDIFLPKGWKVAAENLKNGYEIKRYMSPEGKLIGNLSKALKHILLAGDVSEDQMEILKDSLEYDGWVAETKLPDGWKVKIEGNTEHYLSPNLDFFSNKNEVSKYLVKSGLKEDSERFLNLGEECVKVEESLQTDWKEDYFLPDGWKTCWFRLAEKSKFRKFMSPSGRIYQARSSAIKEMIVNNHPEKDIEIMRKGLFSDGWVEMKDLPQGWLKFTTGNGVTKFLSPEFHAISSKPKEIEKAFTKHDLDRALIPLLREEYYKERRSKTSMHENNPSSKTDESLMRKDNIVSESATEDEWVEDPSLPSGWQICWDMEPPRNHKFKTSSDRIIIGRSSAMRVMIAENYPEKDIEKVKKGFASDGWKPTTYLPDGWMKRESNNKVMSFLTPEFQVIKDENVEFVFAQYKLDKSLITLLKWEKSEEENIDDLLDKDPEDDPNSVHVSGLPKDWRGVKVNDGGEFLILNPAGEEFKSRIEALQFMIKSSYDAKTIHTFWRSLEEEGWRTDERIPSGFRVRCLDDGDCEYLSSNMTLLSSTKEAVDWIQNSGNFEQIIKFEAFVNDIKKRM